MPQQRQTATKTVNNTETSSEKKTPVLIIPEPSNTVSEVLEISTQSKPAKTPKQQRLKPGDLVYSIGGGFVYEIRSYPVCRIYYDYSPNAPYLLSYHAMEGLTAEDREKGLKKPHLSYLATVYNSALRCNGEENLFYITDNGLKLVNQTTNSPLPTHLHSVFHLSTVPQ